VCGRTLLRGENAEIYISGGTRRSVCELCTSRALHGGWVREGTVPEYDETSSRIDRRRSLFGRLRGRRDAPPVPGADDAGSGDGAGDAGALEGEDGLTAPVWPDPPPRPERSRADRRANGDRGARRAQRQAERERSPARDRPAGREPRHVRAVPTSIEHRISSAVELFNASEHPRVVSGIARSLGLPDVSVHPSDPVGSTVNVVVAWELCWYRYEVDLSDEVPSVRAAGQGYELDELSVLERENNAAADERGQLALAG
jgi:hypothetical protein